MERKRDMTIQQCGPFTRVEIPYECETGRTRQQAFLQAAAWLIAIALLLPLHSAAQSTHLLPFEKNSRWSYGTTEGKVPGTYVPRVSGLGGDQDPLQPSHL